ncbi:DUF1992 domain-containing protein [Paeniglutamicibacter antarcticus]|uniref:DUF1992 domain-containing protein n=1 Tax=Arthrobacter terrae TaxID=2935737 RepID=A0A931CN56_9MICC|nr:DUF1992 domain-containing protein [Arthrobacter terrae]MBG0737904.1 DUF1992 domain-containing protein [Arthrobacter terrae]
MESRPGGDRGRRLEQAAELRAARSADRSANADIQHRAEDAREEARRQRKKTTAAGRAEYLIQDAMARGDFDKLEYAGKPIPGLGGAPDPDWWIKGLIQREHLTGLGPKAIMLRGEDAGLDDRLDTFGSAKQVHEVVEDFNARVIDARRQLLGGPPVVTKTRDADLEVFRWQERRTARAAVAQVGPARQPGRLWWLRIWRRPL